MAHECIYVQESLPEMSRGLEMHQRALCHFKYLHVSWLASSFLETSVWKSFHFAFGCVCWVFFSLGEAVGGTCLSLPTLFLSLKPLFVIFPPPQIPRSQNGLKLTLPKLVLHFSYLENWPHIQWQRRWAAGKSHTEWTRDQTSAISTRQLHLPHSLWRPGQPGMSYSEITAWSHRKVISEVFHSHQSQPDGNPLIHWDYSGVYFLEERKALCHFYFLFS